MESAARLFTVGFSGTSLSDELRGLLDRGVGGVVLFRRNITSLQQLAKLAGEIKGYARHPVWLAVDQEGGSVQRVFPPRFASLRKLGEIGDARTAEAFGNLVGTQLRALGIDWNFSPVLDVDTNPLNPVIGPRSLSRDPAVVSRLGVALATGLERANVASCAKHFPGHGDTHQDSHLALPRLSHDLARLRSVELRPFRAYAQAQLASVMTAHVVFDALDSERPATMAPAVIARLLRGELRFEGLVVSDDLEMKAVAEHFDLRDATKAALRAGVDQFLVCHQPELAHCLVDAVKDACQDSPTRGQVEQAVARAASFAERWVRPAEQPEKSADAWSSGEALERWFQGLQRSAGEEQARALRQLTES